MKCAKIQRKQEIPKSFSRNCRKIPKSLLRHRSFDNYYTNILATNHVVSLLTAAWNTLTFTKFWKSGFVKYVCTNSVFSSGMAATMLMMSSLKVI